MLNLVSSSAMVVHGPSVLLLGARLDLPPLPFWSPETAADFVSSLAGMAIAITLLIEGGESEGRDSQDLAGVGMLRREG